MQRVSLFYYIYILTEEMGRSWVQGSQSRCESASCTSRFEHQGTGVWGAVYRSMGSLEYVTWRCS